MFSALYEAFQNGPSDDISTHGPFVNRQRKTFQARPNMILSSTPGLNDFDQSIQSVEPTGKAYQPPPIANPNGIFIKDVNVELERLAAHCTSSSLDELIRNNPSYGNQSCGWMYSPPASKQVIPKLSKGAMGDESGPFGVLSDYNDQKKWFFDLQAAKQQILLDKCKALTNCNDVESTTFKGDCGYCTSSNQGVPINSSGGLQYESSSLGSCMGDLITTVDKCPDMSDKPPTDSTCIPVNGKLSANCLLRTLQQGGCGNVDRKNDGGAIAAALQASNNLATTIDMLRNSDAVKLYNRTANPPLKLELFNADKVTVDHVLREVRQLAANTTQSDTSSIGAAARDLCIHKGSLEKYDPCSELSDGSVAPFIESCLQKIFLTMGGHPRGTAYPSSDPRWNTMPTYNNMGTLGAVKQYFTGIQYRMNSSDYATQRDAMMQFLGVTPERLIRRAPYMQGVEVWWLTGSRPGGNESKINGLLRRSIEDNIDNVDGQSNVNVGGAFLMMTDIRKKQDTQDLLSGYPMFGNLSINTPATTGLDRPQQSNTYCAKLYGSYPNIVRILNLGFQDFKFTSGKVCQSNGSPGYYSPMELSLTCEDGAPFLAFEVVDATGRFQELRAPEVLEQFVGQTVLDVHNRSLERSMTPGKKGFVRMNSASSQINMPNIAFQSWKTLTLAIRPRSTPMKETIFHMFTAAGQLSVVVQNGSITLDHNLNGSNRSDWTPFSLGVSVWSLLIIENRGTSVTVSCNRIDSLISGIGTLGPVSVSCQRPIGSANKTWNFPEQGEPCNVMVGTAFFKNTSGWNFLYSTTSFTYDLAWIHFFDYYLDSDDRGRDSKGNWIYTAYPDKSGQYKTTE